MKKHNGVTLVELMVVVLIIGLIASIVYPSYTDYIRDARRADCMGVLMDASQALERFYTENFTYQGAAIGSNGVPAQCPDAGNPTYTLSLAITGSNRAYTLTATPVGDQAGDGVLTLDSEGNKTWGTRNSWDRGS